MLKLKELRESRGLTQQQVADHINKTFQAYSLYEKGKRQPDYDTLIKLATFFGVTTDYILGNSPDTKPALTDLPGTTPVTGRRVKLPIIGVVRAGPGGIAYEEPIGEE